MSAGASHHRLRDRTDDLILDLLAALRTASLGEITETTRALERRKRTRASARGSRGASSASFTHSRKVREETPSDGGSSDEVQAQDRTPDNGKTPERPPQSRSPFDITIPNELLEPATSARSRGSRKLPDLLESEAAEEQAPEQPQRSVSLREGEELLRTGGSGAIIRRARTT